MKKKLLFVITQFYKGGAEVALLNLFRSLSKDEYEIDFLIFDQMVLTNAESLIKEIPSYVNVCNAAEKEGKFAVVLKIIFKLYRKLTKHQLYRLSAYRFVKSKKYDIAFSYGEWMSPEFVAKKVNAEKKMVWIHTDIDKAKYVDENILLGYDEDYSYYIFVSEMSKRSAELKYEQIRGKSKVIHNMCDEQKILELSKDAINNANKIKTPFILSVGNLRTEKNYPRQIEVMKELKNRGIALTWICIGSTANTFVYQQVKTMLAKYQLQEDFLFLGVDGNPYKYMSKAEAVVVLSDFESWSLVISEAKIIGTPVIATKTSGAMEQIIDGETGILTGFEVNDIADKIQYFIEHDEYREKIKQNSANFSMSQNVIEEFEKVVKG